VVGDNYEKSWWCCYYCLDVLVAVAAGVAAVVAVGVAVVVAVDVAAAVAVDVAAAAADVVVDNDLMT
jgi:uncharacterized protein (DUF2062 family)